MAADQAQDGVAASSTRPGPPPTWLALADGRPAASGCARPCRTAIGRPRPWWRACACPGSPHCSCSTGRSTATPSRLTSIRSWCLSLPPATSSSWTTSAATRVQPCGRQSRRQAHGCCSCRPTRPNRRTAKRLQPDRDGVLEAQSTAPQGGRTHRRGTVVGHRTPRRHRHTRRVHQLLRRSRIRTRLNRKFSSSHQLLANRLER